LDEGIALLLKLLLQCELALLFLHQRVVVETLDGLLDVSLAAVDQESDHAAQLYVLAFDRVGDQDGQGDHFEGGEVEEVGEIAVEVDGVYEDEEDSTYEEYGAAFC